MIDPDYIRDTIHQNSEQKLNKIGRKVVAGVLALSVGVFAKSQFDNLFQSPPLSYAPWGLVGIGTLLVAKGLGQLYYLFKSEEVPPLHSNRSLSPKRSHHSDNSSSSSDISSLEEIGSSSQDDLSHDDSAPSEIVFSPQRRTISRNQSASPDAPAEDFADEPSPPTSRRSSPYLTASSSSSSSPCPLDELASRLHTSVSSLERAMEEQRPTNDTMTIEIDGIPLLLKEYQRRTGTRYIIGNRWNVASLQSLADSRQTLKQTRFARYVAKQYNTYRLKAEQGHTNIGLRTITDGPLEGQWEAVASRDIKPGEIITDYAGDVVSLRAPSTAQSTYQRGGKKNYRLASIEDLVISPTITGSMAEFINHGFPNCLVLATHYHGLPVNAVIATRYIKKGETLYHNYGPEYFKAHGIQEVELNRQGIDQFLQTTRNLTTVNHCLATDGFLKDTTFINSFAGGKLNALQVSDNDGVYLKRLHCKGTDAQLRYLHERPYLLEGKLSGAHCFKPGSDLLMMWEELG